MARNIFSYQLSQEAENDLGDIYDYTAKNFGVEQAIEYLTGFENAFDGLCNNPASGRNRNEIRKDLRSISYASHTIFYRIIKDVIRIVRILHGSRDIARFLPSQD